MVTPQHVELINMCFSEYLITFHVYSVEYLGLLLYDVSRGIDGAAIQALNQY